MKHLVTLALLLTVCVAGWAQNPYKVYKITGTVKYIDKKQQKNVELRQMLTDDNTLNIVRGSQIVLIDTVASAQYTITLPGTHKVKTLIEEQTSTKKPLSKMYLSYLLKQLSGSNEIVTRTAVDDAYATVTRDLVVDSVRVDTVQVDTLQ